MWIILALSASVFWGLTYVFSEQIYKKISVPTTLAITSFFIAIIALAASYFSGFLKRDLVVLQNSFSLKLLVGVEIIVLILAEVLIAYSITNRNATVAGFIEISYPIFIAIFSYLLFREDQLNIGALIGGALIFMGVIVMYAFNK